MFRPRNNVLELTLNAHLKFSLVVLNYICGRKDLINSMEIRFILIYFKTEELNSIFLKSLKEILNFYDRNFFHTIISLVPFVPLVKCGRMGR